MRRLRNLSDIALRLENKVRETKESMNEREATETLGVADIWGTMDEAKAGLLEDNGSRFITYLNLLVEWSTRFDWFSLWYKRVYGLVNQWRYSKATEIKKGVT